MLCAALSVIIVDETVLYVAVPSLFRELRASSAEVQWAIDAYVVVYAALLFPAGNLGDRYGRRTFLLIGLGIFAAGSAVAAWAGTPATLVSGRVVMAVGGALIMPQTLSILVEVFPARQRALAIGIWSAVSGIAIAAGPVVGGYLLEHFWWGSVFLVNLPIVLVAALGTVLLLPNHHDPDASPADFPGTALAVVALLGVLYAIIEGPARGFGSPAVVVAGVVGVVAAVAFVWVERRSASPMLDFVVFREPVVVTCIVIMVIGFATLQGTGLVLTQYLQLIQGRGPLATGLVFAPVTIGWSATAPFSPWLVRRFGYRLVLTSSVGLNVLCYLALATLGDDSGLTLLLLVFALQGVAMGISITPVTDLLMAAVPKARAGIASALNDVSRQVGAALGVAVLGSLLTLRFKNRLSLARPEVRADSLTDALRQHGPGLETVAHDAFISGYRWAMLVSGGLMAVAAAVAWRTRYADGSADAGTP